MARQFWPKSDPLNDKIWIGKGIMSELAAETPREIIGIVGDVRDGALNRDPGPTMYVPNAQVPDALNALNTRITPIAWIVHTRGNPYSLSGPIQEQLRQVSGLPVSDIRTMDEVISRSTSRERFNMLLMTTFGSAALLLAAIGIYGLMAYSVEQRTQEIGIRLALGAESANVRKMIIAQGMWLALKGVVIGSAGAYALTRIIASLLFGVTARDPLVLVSVPVLLSAVSFVAIWLPARHATHIDPVIALRYE
jgi:ABC-type antimicrobial peptide transport system permease subunit